MMQRAISQLAQGRRAGFTLLEVMLAMVIIAFGVLSVSALFAGGVAQQRRASDQSLAVALSRNADAMLSRAIGRLEGSGLAAIPVGEWEPLYSQGPRDPKLRVNPSPTDKSIYFVLKSREQVVYENPALEQNPGFFIPANGSYTVLDSEIRPLPHERIVSTSFSIFIEITDNAGVPSSIELIVNDLERARIEMDDRFESVGEVIFADDTADPMNSHRISVNFAREGRNEITTLSGLMFDPLFPLPAGSWVSRITVGQYDWRSETIASLNDRVLFVDAPAFPYGKRPAVAYTALRRTTTTGAQLMIVTYGLQAIDKPTPNVREGEAAFIPPEASYLSNEDQLLRETRLSLGFDEDRQQFFVEGQADEEEDRFAIAIGQILIMYKSQGGFAGSDVPVKIVSVQTSPTDEDLIRGYLDRSPRVDGQSPLRDLGSREQIDVWALQQITTSLADDESEWEITPIDARVFQLGS